MESTNTTPAAPFATADRNLYGAQESNGLLNGTAYHEEVDYSRQYTLAEVAEAGGKITRVRLLTERGLADVSYIHATLPNGQTVPVRVEIPNLTPLRTMKAEMIKWAKEQHVFAKRLGLLDEGNWSVLR